MKKHLQFITILISFKVLPALAQVAVYHPFPDSNVVWNFHYSMFCLGSGNEDQYYSFSYSGDTLINSLKYHKLNTNFVETVISGSCIGAVTKGYQGAIRQDATIKKVFFIPPTKSSEQLLYDFNMQKGDTVKGFTEPCKGVIINSIDSVLVGSNYRKRWNLKSNYIPCFIEGIGSTYGLIGKDFCGTDGGGFSLTCFKQNGITEYPGGITDCETITSINNIEVKSASLSIYPNPTSSTFSIHSSATPSSSIPNLLQVYNIAGKLILSQILQGGNAEIDASGWAEGVYDVKVSGDAGVENKRVVVVR